MLNASIDGIPVHREKSDSLYSRYIGYKLLEKVRFDDEPVCPRIVKEGKDAGGDFLEVEELEGMDLSDFIQLNSVDFKTKMRVFMQVAKQWQAIDDAGFVLTDRHGSNIRVTQFLEKISIRQIDIEEIYDKLTQAAYAGSRSSTNMLFDLRKELGRDLWSGELYELLEMEIKVCEQHKMSTELIMLLKKLKREEKTLAQHIDLLAKIIDLSQQLGSS